MSTRSKKGKSGSVQQQVTTTVTRVSSSSTGAAETPAPSTPASSSSSSTAAGASTSFSSASRKASSPGRMRPPSPTMISRTQEKRELAGLNDRLAGYIDKVRSLEIENSRLTKQVAVHEETVTREVTNIKGLYETELQDARRLLDETAREKAKLKLENDKLATENKELKERAAALERELADVKRQKLGAEAQVNDLQARLNDAVNQRKHWEGEFNKSRRELDELRKQYALLQKQHEEEVVQRVDLQNRIQSLKEELSFKASVHESELDVTRTRIRSELEETDGRMQVDYENKLREALQQMREENDERIEQARQETESILASKIAGLRELAEQKDKEAGNMHKELREARKRITDLSSQVTSLSSQNAGYANQLEALEARLARQEEEHASDIRARDAEIQRLRDALEDQLSEYRDLLDIKIQLDNEIQSYRRMLESEETRLNISVGEEATPSSSHRRGAKKRKRDVGDFGSFLEQSQMGYSQKSSAKSALEVNETDTDGRYVKLFNNSDADQALGGYQIKHLVGDQETIYKFHRNATLKANQYVTVWSSDSGEAHAPPSNLVMKGQRWFTGDTMTTQLINPQGEEMATRELSKSMLRTSAMYSGRASLAGSSSSEPLEGDPRQEKCAIM